MKRLSNAQIKGIIVRRSRGKSLDTIAGELRIDRNVVWYHVRRFDRGLNLSKLEIRRRRSEAAKIAHAASRKMFQERLELAENTVSPLWKLACQHSLSTSIKGKIAETATLLRLLLLGADVYTRICDGADDWLVWFQKKIIRIQVKMAQSSAPMRTPFIHTRKNNGEPYTTKDCDFFVAYSLRHDACFILPVLEAKKSGVTGLPEKYREKWDLLLS